MSPATAMGSGLFLQQPQAGSGLRILTQRGWAPGNAPAMAVVIPPGSGAILSERDRRLAARHEERRRRHSQGPQEGPADKGFQEREQERQAFERAAIASKQSTKVERHGSAPQEGIPSEPRKSSALRAALPQPTGDGGAVGRSLAAALDQKVAEKSAREVKYEEKRRQYLATKRRGIADESRVRFQEPQLVQSAPVVSGPLPTTDEAPFSGRPYHELSQRKSYELRDPSSDPPPPAENHWTSREPERTERLKQDRPEPEYPRNMQSPARRRESEQESTSHKQSPARIVGKNPNEEYARQLREQMLADSVAAQRAKEDERRLAAALIAPPEHGQSLAYTREVRRGAGVVESPTIDRKAEYAHQLREQMAADQAARNAKESEWRSTAAAVSSGVARANGEQGGPPRGDGSGRVDGSVKDTKAEYARQLREQMIAKENAQRAAKAHRGDSPSNAGPSWIECATEGRIERRKRLNAEYADQLRAQIAAQKSINQAEQSRIASQMDPAKEFYRYGGHERDNQQQRQQGLGHSGLMEEQRRRYERQQFRREGYRSDEAVATQKGMERDHYDRHVQGGANNSLELERQKRVDLQRQYAEALRRDMATPKVDPLGRPIEDITSPSRIRQRTKNSKRDNEIRFNKLPDRDGWSSGPHENGCLKPGSPRQAGSDTREWNQQYQYDNHHRQEQQYPQVLAPQTGARPAPREAGRRWYGEAEQLRSQPHPPPRACQMDYGGNSEGPRAGVSYNEDACQTEVGRDVGWVGDTVDLPSPRGTHGHVTRDGGWGGGWRQGVEQRQGRRRDGSTRDPDNGNATRQQSQYTSRPLGSTVAGGAWGGVDGGEYPSANLSGQRREHGVQQEHGYSKPGVQPGGAPVGVGGGVVSTKASTMHNPVDPDELARIQAKKDSYRKDLEAQMAEHKQLLDQRKRGIPGSKEAEVFHLQEAMEERNERNKMAPGYEMGPLGVAVMKDNYSSSGRGKRSPPKMRAPKPASAVSIPPDSSAAGILGNTGGQALLATTGIFGVGEEGGSMGGGDGEGTESVSLPTKRGSGLRDLLGTETNAERDRERSRAQAEALKKQVEDNKARRDNERAQQELDEQREELRIQKEREQLFERYEQEGKLAKALESERLQREAEQARLAHAARKEKEATESREKEKREEERVQREQQELEAKYAKERAAEVPLGQASSGPPKPTAPEIPAKVPAATGTPRPTEMTDGTEPPLVKTQFLPAATAVAPIRRTPGSPIKSTSTTGPRPGSPGEVVSIQRLRTELWKQKQLTEVLRREVGQQEAEKRKLLDIARHAKESEAAALRAAHERRASQRVLAQKSGNAGSKDLGNELWRVPPPPVIEGVEGKGGRSSPKPLQPAESADPATKYYVEEYGDDRGPEAEEGTVEDRLLLAGLRRLSDNDHTAAGARGSGSSRKEELGGDTTFRERVPGARAWSNGMASASRDGGPKGLLARYHPVSPGGIRAESRYVFPDGSVRRGIETPGTGGGAAEGDGVGVPMPLVGTSRIDSADLSLGLGIDALGGGETPGRDDGNGSAAGGAYRGPGAAPGAGWAPGGRPPRAYVPFLNLPALNGKRANADDDRWGRWRHGYARRRGSSSSSVNNSSKHTGGDSPSLLPPVYSAGGKRGEPRRGRPLAGIGGVPVSPGRAMLTGPGRPGTGLSSSSGMTFGDDANSEVGRFPRPHRSRRRFSTRGEGNGHNNRNREDDEEHSDGGDSAGSGSTDVEFLRRRAEAKLRSLDKHEATDRTREEELDVLVASSSAQSAGAVTESRAPHRQRRPAVGAGAAAPIHTSARRTFSAASSSSRSLMYSCRRKRPGTNQSESSMLGESRWAMLQAK